MHILKGKKILLGITGSISAYKAAILTRLLIKAGAEVKVIMTESATEFITPLTLSTLSKHPVLTQFISSETGIWNNHVELGLWADVFIIAPATAKTIASLANGFANDMLITTYLSARCPIFVAPAMDLDMYKHPATKANLKKLVAYGNHIIHPENGELASGLVGEGRLAEPEMIIANLILHFSYNEISVGKRVLITAGPTIEPIDPVRYVSNRSSGKMGLALADAFTNVGCQVTLISGPIKLETQANYTVIKVETAANMLKEVEANFEGHDLIIFAAAVADYTPKVVANQKIKKKTPEFEIEMVKTVDIAAKMGLHKKQNQIIVGFALETENETENAINKLKNKNFDYIVLNSLNDKGAGFIHDTNKISVIDKNQNKTDFPLKSKSEVAQDILNIIINKWSEA